MPHTSHRKTKQRQHQQLPPRNKRGEVVCGDGWSKIVRSDKTDQLTTAGLEQDRTRTARTMTTSREDHDHEHDPDPDPDEGWTRMEMNEDPADVPHGASLETALSHYQKCEAAWKLSDSWTQLKRAFEDQVSRDEDLARISTCICFGLGSPTGLYGPTAVDRRNVAMYQLVVFKSIIDLLSHHRQHHDAESDQAIEPLEILAQEPRFNHLDISLLSTLSIQTVPHPQAFHHIISGQTFTFCPGAEQFVVRGTLSRLPAIYMGSSTLETYIDEHTGNLRSPQIGASSMLIFESPVDGREREEEKVWLPSLTVREEPDDVRGAEIIRRFRSGKRIFKLPPFDGHGYALHDLYLFWRCVGDDDDDKNVEGRGRKKEE